MKKLLLLGLMALMATSAFAQNPVHTLLDLNTGIVPELTVVDVPQVVVTSVRYNGFSATDMAYGPYTAAWVYTGGSPGVMIGDVVDLIGGTYKEYYDLTEVDLGGGSLVITGNAPVPPIPMSLADVRLDDEAWENHVLHITDGFVVTEMLNYGNWNAMSYNSWGVPLLHDDYFFDETTLFPGICYDGVIGLYTYAYGAFTMEPLVDGIVPVDCTIGTDVGNWNQIKTMYR